MTTEKINTAIPLSLHAANIERHFARDAATGETVHDDVLGQMRDAVAAGRAAAEAMHEAHGAIMANKMATKLANLRSSATTAKRHFEAAAKRHDAAFHRAHAELAAIEKATSAPPAPRDAVAAMLAGEIRSRLAAMKDDDRRKALEAALAEGDQTTLGAMLTGPAMLSGLSKEAHDVLRESWRRRYHAAEVGRADRIRAAVADLERAGEALIGFHARLTPRDAIAEAEGTEARARAAVAKAPAP